MVRLALPPPCLILAIRSVLVTAPGTTWYVRIRVRSAFFSGLSSPSTVPLGSAENAALVGANTVNGPAPFSVSTSPAALTAATRVVWSLELTALSMMSLLAYIAAPPTIGLLCAAMGAAGACAKTSGDVAARQPISTRPANWIFMTKLPNGCAGVTHHQVRREWRGGCSP